jgi:hypothetical protein
MKIVYFLLMIICFLSCGSKIDQNGQSDQKPGAFETASISQNDDEVDILLPAGYRGTEPSEFRHMYLEDWYDFYKDPDSEDFYLKKADLIIEKFYDDCLQDSTTGVSSKRESLLLIEGLTPKNSLIKSIPVSKQWVWVGEKASFELNGKKYTFRGDGMVLKSDSAYLDGSDEPQRWDEVADYKLYLSEDGVDGEQLLVDVPKFEDTFVQILWIGDLDEDGKPDFILDVSPHYEYKRVMLFLSSKAGNGEIVKCAGSSEYGFDC